MTRLSDSAQHVVQRLPVVFSVCLIVGSWLLFITFVSVKQVLLVRGDTGRFIMQLVVFDALALMSLLSYAVAVSRHPIRPDQTFAPPDARPLLPDDALPPSYAAAAAAGDEEDDIPLRVLRNARHGGAGASGSRARRGRRDAEDAEYSEEGAEEDADADEDAEEDAALLGKEGEDDEPGTAPTVLMAKGGTGGPRWCRKCDGWKPDRCHHCRACRQCVLKMDHHCPWLDNCVGYHNYKPFILFLTYCTLMCLFGAWQSAYEVYYYFKHPMELEPEPMEGPAHAQGMEFELMPVIWMILTILGGVFGIAIGGMCGYHWYLLLNNRTTLEDLTRTVPTALLDSGTRAVLEELGQRGSRRRLPGAWRPDHIMTRPERTRLRNEAREINVYDVGWRRNLRSVMSGDGVPPLYTFRGLVGEVRRAAWPLYRPRMRQYGAGHFFDHDPSAVQQLKALTSELRLGLGVPDSEGAGGASGDADFGEAIDAPPPFSHSHSQRHDLGEWTIGRSDTESEDDENE